MSSSQLSSSKPCRDREETINRLKKICFGTNPQKVYGEGPILISDIPESCKYASDGVILGIDEAGRGPVLSAMTYGAAFWNKNDTEHIPKGLTDSKQLSSNTRQTLFDAIQS
jgi:ribonuclease H2 subunit A